LLISFLVLSTSLCIFIFLMVFPVWQDICDDYSWLSNDWIQKPPGDYSIHLWLHL
jgi:hypothetical protein